MPLDAALSISLTVHNRRLRRSLEPQLVSPVELIRGVSKYSRFKKVNWKSDHFLSMAYMLFIQTVLLNELMFAACAAVC